MFELKRILGFIMFAGLLLMSCEPEHAAVAPVSTDTPKQEEPQKPAEEPPVISPAMTSIPSVHINTPGKKGVQSKTEWVELATIAIKDDKGQMLYQDDSLKIRGRGNSTWWYAKKPYNIKLDHKADLIGTGKSKKWVLLANWMDRTLLRNEIALEAARRTSIDWNPKGRFVKLYLDDNYLGVYWLGEKIEVEESRIKADLLLSFDNSDQTEFDFFSNGTYQANLGQWGAPVEVKFPDRDDYKENVFAEIIGNAGRVVDSITDDIAAGDLSKLDVDSFCDWYLIHELCFNLEPNHPKSCFFHWRDGKMYAGPVWDFDWYTFIPDQNWLGIKNSMWFGTLLKNASFRNRLKERWTELKPSFVTLPYYVDNQAEHIREVEAVNHEMWPCESSGVNGDETLSFQEAVDRLKLALTQRIDYLDKVIPAL